MSLHLREQYDLQTPLIRNSICCAVAHPEGDSSNFGTLHLGTRFPRTNGASAANAEACVANEARESDLWALSIQQSSSEEDAAGALRIRRWTQ
jgi:hypothetical protein